MVKGDHLQIFGRTLKLKPHLFFFQIDKEQSVAQRLRDSKVYVLFIWRIIQNMVQAAERN